MSRLPILPRQTSRRGAIIPSMSNFEKKNNFAKICKSSVIPALRYRDALAGIEWLCKAFGFEKNAVYMGEGNIVAHAQLTFGNGMVMLGSIQNGTEYSKQIAQPDEIGMRETQHRLPHRERC